MKKTFKILIITFLVLFLLISAFYLFNRYSTFFLSFFNGDVEINRTYVNDDEQALIVKAEKSRCPGLSGFCLNEDLLKKYQEKANVMNKGHDGYANLLYNARVTHLWPEPVKTIKPATFYNADGIKISESDCRSLVGENFSTVEFYLEYEDYCGNLCAHGISYARWVIYDNEDNVACEIYGFGASWIS